VFSFSFETISFFSFLFIFFFSDLFSFFLFVIIEIPRMISFYCRRCHCFVVLSL